LQKHSTGEHGVQREWTRDPNFYQAAKKLGDLEKGLFTGEGSKK
jgi:hypothetical protein